jgi:F-type H+-transporting ATPase subunit a
LFFFIWINNILGLFPGGANLTGNIAFTMTLAFLTLIIVNVNGKKDYWLHILWMPGVPVWVRIMLAPIELVGVLTKPFALMIRLFANMTAGHIVILSLISLTFIFKSLAIAPAAVGLTLFIYVIKVLVAFLQAYIFALLTALFIGQAVEEHDHH